MSMQNDDDQLSPDEQQLPNEVQAQLRIGRKAARDLEATKAQVAQMELHTAITKAGVPDHPARDVVFQNYDGPLEAEPIRAYAEKFGIVASSPSEGSGPTAEELSAQRQILNAGGGAPAASGDVDLAVALRNCKSEAEVQAILKQVVGTPGFKNRDGRIGVFPEY